MSRHLTIILAVMSLPGHLLAQCPVTANSMDHPFVPPFPYRATLGSPNPSRFWYGSEALWTTISPIVQTSGKIPFAMKLVYWRVGFDWRTEQMPDLQVTAKRLDKSVPLLQTETPHGTKLSGDDSPTAMAMLTVIRFPSEGCWEITGKYKGDSGTTLTYVVSVTP